MRFYSFNNFYLSSIQQGIQAGHVCHALETKYALDRPGYATARAALNEWRDKHMTWIVCNGGCAPLIHQRKAQFQRLMKAAMLPWTAFNEPGLDNALTAFGGVLTADIYDAPLSTSDNYNTTLLINPPPPPPSFDDAYQLWLSNREPHMWTPQRLLTWFLKIHQLAK